MRPYMLWLTRVYALGKHTRETTNWFWVMGVGDWIRRSSEHRFRSEYATRRAHGSKSHGQSPARRTSMSIGSRLRVASQREALRLSRAAGQGGR